MAHPAELLPGMAEGQALRPFYDDVIDYRRLLFMFNPQATNADRALELHAELRAKESYHGFEVVKEPLQTSQYLEGNMMSLEQAEDGDIIVLASGDGGKNEAFKGAGRLGLRNPFLTIPIGNANDIDHNAFGRWCGSDIGAVMNNLFNSVPRLVRPVIVELDGDWGNTVLEGSAYVGAGFTGRMGKIFRSKEWRDSVAGLPPTVRLAKEGLRTVREWPQTPVFTFTDQYHGSRELAEVNFPNGPKEAKVQRFPLDMFKPEAGRLEISPGPVTNLFAGIGKAAVGRFERLREHEEYIFTINSETEITVHENGEDDTIGPGETQGRARIAEYGAFVLKGAVVKTA